MTIDRTEIDLADLSREIRRDLHLRDLNMSERGFAQLSENIARAIALAVERHEAAVHGSGPQPDFGEEERPS